MRKGIKNRFFQAAIEECVEHLKAKGLSEEQARNRCQLEINLKRGSWVVTEKALDDWVDEVEKNSQI